MDELRLLSFGPFTGLNLVFDTGDADFHILYGRNEAGKSSALRALVSLFFGIPHHSTDNFLHDNTKLRIGGSIHASDGSALSLIRRKGTKNTLLDLDEKPLDETVLQRFLQGVDKEIFEAFFGIDHDSLARGGQSILKEGGDVGQSLFSAGIGGVDLRAILQEFDNEADALFRPRGQTQALNKAINDYSDLKKTVSEASLSSRKWSEQNDELKKALGERAGLSEKIKGVQYEASRLRRLQQTLPDIAVRTKWISDLLELGEVVIIDDDFAKKRREYLEQLRTALEVRERSTDDMEQLKSNMTQISVPEGFLDQADTISELHQRLGSYRKGLQDLGGLERNVHQLKREIEVLCSEIKPGADVKECVIVRPEASLRAKVQGLGGSHQAILDALARSDKDIQKTRGELAKATEELHSLEAPRDINALKSAVSSARKRGDLTLSLQEALTGVQRVEEQLKIDLDRLPLWEGRIEKLETITIPSPETVDRFEMSFQEIATKMAGLDDKEKQTRGDLAKIEAQIEALCMAGTVPTENELSQARERRSSGWGLILRSWIDNDAVEEEIAAFDAQDPLPKAYEKSVVQADEISDRLRREADRVAQNANLIAQKAGAQQYLKDIEGSRQNLADHLCKIEVEWTDHWKASGIKPLPPKEMRAWTIKQDALLEKSSKSRELRRNYEQIVGQIGEYRAGLIACLGDLGLKLDTNKAFDDLLDYCQSVIESIDAVNRKRAELNEHISKLENDTKGLYHNHETLEKKYKDWQSGWATALSRLGLESQASPAEAYAVLSKFDELFKKVDEKDSIEQRVSGINRDAAKFSADVKSLSESVASELNDNSVEQIVVKLDSTLSKAKTDSARLADLENRLAKQETVLREAEETIKIALKRLESLCVWAGCARYEDLEEIERRSSLKKTIQEKIDSLETGLLRVGGGMPLEELIQETKGVDNDSLPGLIFEVDKQLEEMAATRSDMDQKIGGMQTILLQMDGSAKAAEAAEQSQRILSSMRENVECYIRLRMCSAILNQEIERYRNENQGPLVRRASQLFSALTLESFSGLTTDFNDKDEPILVGIRPRGEKIGVSGMSDGTRDQLYLALRIASLEKYLDSNEPMPFIVDDILIRFDDDRATAALNILAELSTKTQVLFLTHHARLVELARKGSFCGKQGIHLL
jgi:uncharacterized protein YhaN